MSKIKIPDGYEKITWKEATHAKAKRSLLFGGHRKSEHKQAFTRGKIYKVMASFDNGNFIHLKDDEEARHGIGLGGWLDYFIPLKKI
jgi:hypothetical protein